MKIRIDKSSVGNVTVISLSESNVEELYYMMKQHQVAAARKRLVNATPYLFKADAGNGGLVVQIERDLLHYEDELKNGAG